MQVTYTMDSTNYYFLWLTFYPLDYLALVVQTLDSTIHWMNLYAADKYYRNQMI